VELSLLKAWQSSSSSKVFMKLCRPAIVSCLLLSAALAHAAEVRVFVAGASKAAFETLAHDYERTSGNTLKASFDTVGALRDRVIAGDQPDLVILSSAGVDALMARGLLKADGRADLGLVVAGLAVRRGAPVPDISTEAALRKTLLAAESIAQADGARGATSGAHFSKLIDTLGLREMLGARITVLPFGVEAIQGVSDGKYALGVSQSSEIVPIAGVTFVGGLPAPYALRTLYTAAALQGSNEGLQLLNFLRSDGAKAHFAASGFAAP